MARLGRILALLAALLGGLPALSGGAFVLGVAPHTSARVILQMYQPLREHLEKSLGRPVEVATAPDFTEFVRRAMAGSYDLVVTTGHQARLLETDGGCLPLLTYQADFKAVVLVARNAPFRSPRDLSGKPILGLSASSLVTLWGERWISRSRIENATVRYVSASDSVAQLVAAGEAAAGFTSLANYEKLPADLQAKLRFLAESGSMAGRVYLLHGRHKALKGKVEASLWAFAESAPGRTYFEANRLGGYRRLKRGELKEMDPYAAEVRKVLAAKGGE